MLFACVISDTHGHHEELEIPDCDMIIHSGDFSNHDDPRGSLKPFLDWLGSFTHKYKILVAGNHDHMVQSMGYKKFFELCKKYGIIYLQDTSVEIEGILFHGSPWTSRYKTWAFMNADPLLSDQWLLIPTQTEVLITHGPAYGTLDLASESRRAGSPSLKKRIDQLNHLRFHLFGHIHPDYGIKYLNERYISLNAAMMDKNGELSRDIPIIEIRKHFNKQ